MFQCIYEVMTCCHKLEKVVLTLRNGCPNNLLQQNRYLTAIKAIDPDVLELDYEDSD
jgi:hypothetical protein